MYSVGHHDIETVMDMNGIQKVASIVELEYLSCVVQHPI